jgi:pSer/pThr/pTyr-binding forkhead associated (FHA) protein
MRIDSALEVRRRVRYLGTGFGVVALIGLIATWWRTRTRKEPYLEVVQGLDKGKRFRLEQGVTHIGAISEDGGRKNEIVLRDMEHAISRFHCEIYKRDGRVFLVDCASANGTRVDSKTAKPGAPVRLKNGARVTLAESCAVKLRFGRHTENSTNA